MSSKIFINYRRDDDPNGAARVRDGLTAKFGKVSVFMDVDNLLAGQRFDEELAKALSQCDVLIAVMGSRWMELLKARAASGERDYVREEIAEALARKLTVIPVRVGRDGQLPALPRLEDLPKEIRDLVLYQKHDVAHERFGRDIAELTEAITAFRRNNRPQYAVSRVPWVWVAATAAVILGLGAAGAQFSGVAIPWLSSSAIDLGTVAREQKRAADLVAEVKREQDARARAEAEAERLADVAAQERRDREAREKAAADVAARTKLEEEQRQTEASAARRKASEEAAEARLTEELRKAHDEAKKAREALAAAEKERAAALKAAEAARNAQDEARKAAEAAAQQTKFAALPAPEPAKPGAGESDREALARSLQAELKRVGCDPGSVDGKWGAKAKSALADFAKRTKVALMSDEPTAVALDAVTGRKGRICPLQCDDDHIEQSGRCIARSKVAVPKPKREPALARPDVSAPASTKVDACQQWRSCAQSWGGGGVSGASLTNCGVKPIGC